MPIIEPKGLRGLRGITSLSESEYNSFVTDNKDLIARHNYDPKYISNLYSNKQFIDTFGENAFDQAKAAGYDLSARNELLKNKIIGDTFVETFGNDKKLLRMGSEEGEIDPKRGEVAIQRYKYMMINDQNDNESMKKYIMFMKLSVDLNDKQTINDYIDLWNQYLEAFMNDPDAYNELAQVYLMVNEYDKAAFCLEELLLYSPNNYKVLNKLGDIYASKNNAEDAKIGIKFYSRSIIIQPTPRAFFGIQNCASIIIKKEKRLDDKTKNLVDISKKELTKLYADTEFKNFDVNKIFNV
jgi:tetratricopeptide (TPR) repeat protein